MRKPKAKRKPTKPTHQLVCARCGYHYNGPEGNDPSEDFCSPECADDATEPVQYPDDKHASREQLIIMIGHLSDVLETVGMNNESEMDMEDKIRVDRWSMRGRALIGDVPDEFDIHTHEAQLERLEEGDED